MEAGASAIGLALTAMQSLWTREGPANAGMFLGVAPQGTIAPFATLNIVSIGKAIVTDSTTYDDLIVQVSCFSAHRAGPGLALELAGKASDAYHRKTLDLGDYASNALTMRVGSTLAYWIEWENVWMAVATFRLVVGKSI